MSKPFSPDIGRDAAPSDAASTGALGFARPVTIAARPGASPSMARAETAAEAEAAAQAAAAARSKQFQPQVMTVDGSAAHHFAETPKLHSDVKEAPPPPIIGPALIAAALEAAKLPTPAEEATLSPAQLARKQRKAKRAAKRAKRLLQQQHDYDERTAAALHQPAPPALVNPLQPKHEEARKAAARAALAELDAEEKAIEAGMSGAGGSVQFSAVVKSNGIESVGLREHPDGLEAAIPGLERVEAGASDEAFGAALTLAGVVVPVVDANGNHVTVASLQAAGAGAGAAVALPSGANPQPVPESEAAGKPILDLRALSVEKVLASAILRPLFHVFCGRKAAEENLFFLADCAAFLKRLEESEQFAKNLRALGVGADVPAGAAASAAAPAMVTARRQVEGAADGKEGKDANGSASVKDVKKPVDPKDSVEQLRAMMRPSYMAQRTGPEWKAADLLFHDYFSETSAFRIEIADEYKARIRDEYADIAGDPMRGINHVPKLLEGVRADVLKLVSTAYLPDFVLELERQVVAHSIPVDLSSADTEQLGAMMSDASLPAGADASAVAAAASGKGMRPNLVPTINPAVVGDRKIVMIIGGGFCGSTVAGFLDKLPNFYVVLIDTKPYFEYTPSMPKVFLDPTYHKRVVVPHTSYVKRGKVIIGEVRAVRKDCVIVGLEELRFDFLVVATGSHYPSNIKGTSVTASYRGKQLLMERKRLDACKSVVVIGGGVVGVEMSFEIKSVLPHIEVTVIQSQPRFLMRLPQAAHDKVKSEYDRLGIKYVLNERVVKFDEKRDLYVTNAGKEIAADRAYWCGGPSPLTAFMEAEFGDKLGEMGHIKVDEHLLMSGSHNIFAGGDCCSTREEKLAFRAEVHGKVISYNIVAANNGSLMQSYECPDGPDSQVISMGKVNGLMVYNNQPQFGKFVFVKDQLERVEIEDRTNNGDDVTCCSRTGVYCSLLPYFCGCDG